MLDTCSPPHELASTASDSSCSFPASLPEAPFQDFQAANAMGMWQDPAMDFTIAPVQRFHPQEGQTAEAMHHCSNTDGMVVEAVGLPCPHTCQATGLVPPGYYRGLSSPLPPNTYTHFRSPTFALIAGDHIRSATALPFKDLRDVETSLPGGRKRGRGGNDQLPLSLHS